MSHSTNAGLRVAGAGRPEGGGDVLPGIVGAGREKREDRTAASVNVVPVWCVGVAAYPADPEEFASWVVGVGHTAAVVRRFGAPCPQCPGPVPSEAKGVGHLTATSESGRAFAVKVLSDASPDFQSRAAGVGQDPRAVACRSPHGFSLGPPAFSAQALGVGQDEHPLPPVRRPDSLRRKHSPFRIVPEGGKVPENVRHPSNKQASDILKEPEAGS